MIDDIISEAISKMKSAVSIFEQDMNGLRGGRASPTMVERLQVDYYGQETDLRQLASISTPEPMQLLIRPFDKTAVKAIEKAIQLSELHIPPQIDGDVIRLNMPPLTRERRVEMVKMLHKRTEEARVAIRNIRRNSNDDLKEFEREKMISEDEAEQGQAEVQKLTDKYIAEVETMGKAKEKEIMEI
ncbi:MAG: ribosome recycling factor [Chloroflexota bacterium]|nr:ribosome recycling factor [Chloroflexota bacterium]